jgi:hypothetical protein
MSDELSPDNPTSRKGWVDVAYDKHIWIPIPPGFPQSSGLDIESYASGVAQEWWQNSGLRHTTVDTARLTALLQAVHEGTYGHIPCHLVWVHLPDPRLMPLVIYLGIFRKAGDRDEQLRALTHADDRDAVEPPIVEEFTTDKLGTGLKTLRYAHLDGDEALYAALNYAWRSEEYETDLRVFTSSEDLGRLQRALSDIDDFARAITMISKDDLLDP